MNSDSGVFHRQAQRATMTKGSQRLTPPSSGNSHQLTVFCLPAKSWRSCSQEQGIFMSDIAPALAYIAEGKLYTQTPGTAAKLIESPFVQGILDRVERDRERGEWKSQGMAWNFGSQMRGPFGPVGLPADRRRIRFSGVSSAGDGKQLLYSLDTDHV